MEFVTVEVQEADGRSSSREVPVSALVMAGWTGRDEAALMAHVRELEALGVKAPAKTPLFYPMARHLLTLGKEIEVIGDKTSGEVEYVLLAAPEGLLVGVGSDETDREAEAYSVQLSKQLCAKGMASRFWRYDDVKDHWDELRLKAWVTTGERRELYQDSSVSIMLDPSELVSLYLEREEELPLGTVLFSGTFPSIGGVRGGNAFSFELSDPVADRKIEGSYTIKTLKRVH